MPISVNFLPEAKFGARTVRDFHDYVLKRVNLAAGTSLDCFVGGHISKDTIDVIHSNVGTAFCVLAADL